jgi:IS5 family transposase
VAASKSIADCIIIKSKPADRILTEHMINRHDEIDRRHLPKVALDQGFASKNGIEWAKSRIQKIKHVA